MQPPPRAEPSALTWTSRVWVARSSDGRQTDDLVSLSQISQAFRRGVLPPDVEAAVVGEWQWENIRLVLARHAPLAPPGASDAPESVPHLELTLTVQKEAIGRAESGSISSARAVPTLPPPPRAAPEFARRFAATPSLREVLDPSLETPVPARLASLVYGVALVVAALVAVAAIITGIAALFARLNEASDARTVVLAFLVALGWALVGGVVAAVVVVLGRAAAGIVLVAHRIDEKLQEDQEREGR